MKKTVFIFVLTVALTLAASAVGAVNQQQNQRQNQTQDIGACREGSDDCLVVSSEPLVETESEDEDINDDSDDGKPLMVQERQQARTANQGESTSTPIQARARNVQELQAMIKEQRQEFQQELAQLKDQRRQEVMEKQNAVREAVHALLAAEDLTGGIGQQVSAIAREFNNSVQNTIAKEEQIKNRSRLTRFFFGGDQEAAGELEEEIVQNRERIRELARLYQDCNCQQELKDVMQEQIQNMEQEQNRLEEVVDAQAYRGIWGWIKGLFR